MGKPTRYRRAGVSEGDERVLNLDWDVCYTDSYTRGHLISTHFTLCKLYLNNKEDLLRNIILAYLENTFHNPSGFLYIQCKLNFVLLNNKFIINSVPLSVPVTSS